MRYRARSPIAVAGPSTGRRYMFSAADPEQHVDRRDAEALLRTSFFDRVV
ncbi:MAG: hypothetical protein JNL97_04385 [Verrucomicrobiales bacterium]|nr:hypothetical protein [Verrucomicrobiales bacterium]